MSPDRRKKKFMQSLSPEVYKELERIARHRGATVQELLRAVIIPDWLGMDSIR